MMAVLVVDVESSPRSERDCAAAQGMTHMTACDRGLYAWV